MSLTESKRLKHTARYARKDARRNIYRALYGKSEATYYRDKRQNDPTLDFSRKLPYHWDWESAKAIFNKEIDLAAFSQDRKALLEQHLEKLKHYKHQIET